MINSEMEHSWRQEGNILLRDDERIDDLQRNHYGIIQRKGSFCFGMDAVLLTSGCTDPLYRRSARVSMGTVFQVPWAYVPENWPEILKEAGFATAAMALTDDSVSIDAPVLRQQERLAVVLGTEGDGLAEQTIARCDYTVKIPMYHGVDSLNVAAASAVAFWELRARF